MSGAGSTPPPRGGATFSKRCSTSPTMKAGVQSASEADLPDTGPALELAEAEAAIADTKRTYYAALNRRHRALRALAKDTA